MMEKKDQNIQDFCRELATALQRITASHEVTTTVILVANDMEDSNEKTTE
jgi:hypothetical protein